METLHSIPPSTTIAKHGKSICSDFEASNNLRLQTKNPLVLKNRTAHQRKLEHIDQLCLLKLSRWCDQAETFATTNWHAKKD